MFFRRFEVCHSKFSESLFYLMLVSPSQWQMENSVLASVCDSSVLFFFYDHFTMENETQSASVYIPI